MFRHPQKQSNLATSQPRKSAFASETPCQPCRPAIRFLEGRATAFRFAESPESPIHTHGTIP
jgi:hypothetical protein